MAGLFFLSHDNLVSIEEKCFQKLFENPSKLFIYEFKKRTLKGHFLCMEK